MFFYDFQWTLQQNNDFPQYPGAGRPSGKERKSLQHPKTFPILLPKPTPIPREKPRVVFKFQLKGHTLAKGTSVSWCV